MRSARRAAQADTRGRPRVAQHGRGKADDTSRGDLAGDGIDLGRARHHELQRSFSLLGEDSGGQMEDGTRHKRSRRKAPPASGPISESLVSLRWQYRVEAPAPGPALLTVSRSDPEPASSILRLSSGLHVPSMPSTPEAFSVSPFPY